MYKDVTGLVVVVVFIGLVVIGGRVLYNGVQLLEQRAEGLCGILK